MRRLFIVLVLLLIIPTTVEAARSYRLYEKWMIHSEAEIDEWEVAGITNADITPEGAVFDFDEQVVFFRPLPHGFHENVDALRVHLDVPNIEEGGKIEEVSILFITLDDEGGIDKRLRILLASREETNDLYVPLFSYRDDMNNADLIALSMNGEANGVRFEGIRFLRYSLLEKFKAAFNSFWILEPFTPHTINIMVGPVINRDPSLDGWYENWHLSGTSANAYMLVGLSLWGVLLLILGGIGVRTKNQKPKTKNHTNQISIIIRRFFIVVGVVWLLYDLRMGAEFVRNVASDHVQYIGAEYPERVFRDRERFYDFVEFAKPFVEDKERYELFLPDPWPFFGSMRYYTYPSTPNPGHPSSDIWVIYDREDIIVGEDNRLYYAGLSFTTEGEIIGRFDESSFIFKGLYDGSVNIQENSNNS